MANLSERRIIPASKSYELEGPKPRVNEFLFAFQIFKEFIIGFRALHFVGPCVRLVSRKTILIIFKRGSWEKRLRN